MLGVYLRRQQALPFDWATNNCCTFVCDAIFAMTGTDLMKEFRHTPTKAAAARLYARHGGLEKIIERQAQRFGARELTYPEAPIRCGLAQRGDVALIDLASGESALAIVDLNGRELVAMAPDGPVRVPLSAARRAWRIE